MMIALPKIKRAAQLLKNKVLHTPLVHSATLSNMFGANIYLKLENLQKTGSFKIRGATHRLQSRIQEVESSGVVAASAGNHAQGVALAAREAGIPATIVMPEWASITKQEATKGYGGKVILSGQSIEESIETAMNMAKEGLTFIHPFDDEDIVAGQGTIGLEIFQDLNRVDMIIVPVGGGGLIAGIASAAAAIRPETKIIGVQSTACTAAYDAFKTGKITRAPSRNSIADGISVKQVGKTTLPIIRKGVTDMVTVDEEYVAASILMLLERKKTLVEGAAAVTLAALLSGVLALPPEHNVVLVISGGNVDSPLLDRIIHRGLIKKDRLMRLWVSLDDKPGALAGLLALVAKQQANVLHIHHDRNIPGMPLTTTRVKLELETRGGDHSEMLAATLREAGYVITTG